MKQFNLRKFQSVVDKKESNGEVKLRFGFFALVLILSGIVDYIFFTSFYIKLFGIEWYYAIIPMWITVGILRYLNWDAVYVMYGILFKNYPEFLECWEERS